MKPNNEVHRLLYTRAEAAGILRISVSTLDVMVKRGLLTARKMGRKTLIPNSALAKRSQKSVTRIWPRKVGGKTVRPAEKDKAPHRRATA